MATDIVKGGVKFRVLASLSPTTWNRISFWGKAEDCVFNSGDSVEKNLGNITGITSDPSSNAKDLATSAYLTNYLSGEMKTVQLDAAGWSSNTTTLNGVQYHTYTFNVEKVLLAHPMMYLAVDSIPSEAVEDAWGELKMVADTVNNQLIFYTETVPSVNLTIGLKGVE